MTRPTKRSASLLSALLLTSAAVLAGCGADGPPPPPTKAPPTNAKAPDPGTPEPTARTRPETPLATAQTEWPGVEARLFNIGGRGGLLFVEVELANTGTAPVTIERYSATGAQMTDDASKQLYEVFSQPGYPPAATADLTQTLAPGETTTINASFPLPSKAQLVTLVFPKIGRFDAIPLKPKREPPTKKSED